MITSGIDELKVFTGNAHPELAAAVCQYLDIPIGQAEIFKFSNDNTFVRIHENIRQRDVFIIQPTCAPVNDNLMELLIMKEVFCCAIHPVFSSQATELIAKSDFTEVVVADTIPLPPEKHNEKINVLSVAPLLGEAIYRIHKGLSVGELFLL
jgi:phosphoribosylpyrophosphate synthetase